MYKFSIRELLFAVLLVALATGWYVDHRHLSSRPAKEEKMKRKLEALCLYFEVRGYKVIFEDQPNGFSMKIEDPPAEKSPDHL